MRRMHLDNMTSWYDKKIFFRVEIFTEYFNVSLAFTPKRSDSHMTLLYIFIAETSPKLNRDQGRHVLLPVGLHSSLAPSHDLDSIYSHALVHYSQRQFAEKGK